jgi:hypothetical protein
MIDDLSVGWIIRTSIHCPIIDEWDHRRPDVIIDDHRMPDQRLDEPVNVPMIR